MIAHPLATALANPLAMSLTAGRFTPPPVISGFAYPQETLTASRAGQWFVDGIPIIGETGSTFVVHLLDYGRTITCDNSAPVAVWKPQDITGVLSVRVSDRNVLNAVAPDIIVTNGQTIRRFNDQVSNFPADQTVGVNQPIFRSTGQSGNPSVEFDGSNDFMSLSGSELNIFNGVNHAYMFVGIRDSNPTGGSADHMAVTFTNAAGTVSRMIFSTRVAGNNAWSMAGRRIDTDSISGTPQVANDNQYHCHTGEFLYTDNVIRHRVDGVQVGTTIGGFTSGAGPSQASASAAANIGNSAVNGLNHTPGFYTCVIFAARSTQLSATDRSRIERFIGLFGGRNVPLV
jgi:hypothetical protein